MSTSPFYDSILKGTWAIENGKFVHPISKKTYTLDEYRDIAYTPDAVQWRDENKDRLAFINTEGSMDKASRAKIWDIVGSYKSDAGEDLTAAAAAFTVKKLVDQGITNLNQISIEYVPAYAGQVEEVPDVDGGVTEQVVGASPERWVYRNKTTGAIVNPVIFADGAGTTITLQPNGSNGNYSLGMAKNYSQFDKLVSQLAEYVDPNSTGGSWSTQSGKSSGPGFGPEGMLRELASSLWNKGVSNLSDLAVRDVDTKNLIYVPADLDSATSEHWKNPQTNEVYWETPQEIYNKKTGAKINDGATLQLGSWGQGPGITHANLRIGENGKPVISTRGEDTGFDPMLLGMIITIATFGVGGPAAIGAFLTGGAATGVAAVAVGSAAVSFATNIAMGVPPLKALENSIKSAGAAYVGQMVGAMLPQELAAVGSSAVKQIIQTGKLDLAQLAIAGASGLATDAIAAETGLSKDLAGTLAGAGMAALTGKEKVAIEMLQNAAVRTVFNSFAAESGLTQQEKNFLQLGVGQLLNVAKGGKFNPISLVNDMMNLGMSQAAAAKVVGQNVPNDQRSQTAIGAVSSDSSGNLYSTDDDGNRLVLTGTDAGRLYTAAEWNGIQAALNTGQAQFVSSVIKNMNDGVFTLEEAQQELKDAGYSATQIQKVIDANQQFITRAANAKSIIQNYTTEGSGYDRATALAALQKDAGYTAEDAERVLGNLDTNIRNQRSVGQFINAYAEPGSDVSRDAVINQLKGLMINGQRQYSDADIERIVGNADKVTAARNDYANTTRNFLSGAATEKQLTDAMDAAGISGQAKTDQLTYYRAIKAGSELTSSEATQAAVAGLNTWNLLPDRKGTQVVFGLNDEGSPYVKEARDAQGKDITSLFYGSSPQALQQYVTQENQKYADRMKSTLTTTAEKFFAPGATMSNDQAITALKATGLTDAMAKDVVAGWNTQKEAIGRNSITIDQPSRTTSRILTFEEFERMLGAVNVKDQLVNRYQAYLYTNGELLRTGNLPNGQFLFPGEVTGVLDRSIAAKELPRNSTIDQIAQEVYKGIAAGSAVGSPAQNFINSLNANFLSLFPRVGAGITSVVMGDAANDVAVALRGIAEIGSKVSDQLMPDLAAEANKRMADIGNASGFVNKMVKAWDWATASPLSLGSLAWTASKELSEDMLSFALLGKALQVVGSSPGKALGLAMTDLALNYGGITEENIAELTQQGLDPKLAAQLAGQGAMPAALAETIVGTVMGAIPIDKVTKNSAFRNLIATPYHANIDGMEEGASYIANQIGMGRPVELNDALTSYVIGAAVGGKANVITNVGEMLTGQGQGNLLKSIDEEGLKTGIDPKIIPNDSKGTVSMVVGDIAVVTGPDNQSYVIDISNQEIKPGEIINVKGFDTTESDLTNTEINNLLTTINGAFQSEFGRDATYGEIAGNLNQLKGKTDAEIKTFLNSTPEGVTFDKAVSLYQQTLGRAPTQKEAIAAVAALNSGQTEQQVVDGTIKATDEYAAIQASISKSISVSLSQEAVKKAISESESISQKIAEDALKAVSISRSISESISISTANSISRAADEAATQDWVAPDGTKYKIPKLWDEYTVDRKIEWFNENGWTATKLQSGGVKEEDIAVLVEKGLKRGEWKSADEIKLEAEKAAEAEKVSISNSISESISTSELEVENSKTIDWVSPNKTVIQIPAKWDSYTNSEKINWFKEKKYTATTLQTWGVSDKDLTAYVALGLDRGGWRSEAEIKAQQEADAIKISQDALKAASVSESLSQSESMRLAAVAKAEADRISTSNSISLSIKAVADAKAEADRISTSNSISLSQVVAAAEKAEAARISTSKAVAESISISNKIKEDALKATSVSQSISASQSASISASKSTSQSLSVSKSVSISESTSLSILDKQWISEQASISKSESISVAASISKSKAVSVSESASLSILEKQWLSELASISKSESLSLSTSVINSISASKSASLSTSVSVVESQGLAKLLGISASTSKSISESISTSVANASSISASISQMTKIEEDKKISLSTSISASNSISESLAKSASISKSISISQKLESIEINQRTSVSNSISISESLSQSASTSISQSVSQAVSNSISISESLSQSASTSVSQSVSQSISESVSNSTSQSVSTSVNPTISVSESTSISESTSVSQSVSTSVTISTTQSTSTSVEPTVSVATSINTSVTVTPTVSVTETPTETITFSPTLVITTPTPTVTVTESFELTTPPPTIPWPPTLSFTETTSLPPTTTPPVTTTKPPVTTTKPPVTTTKPPPFPLFFVPGYDQTKRYIDYAQPNVPPPEFGPYDPFKAPNYLRPLQDAGNFGIAALVGAFNDGKPGNGGNQPK